MLKQQECYRKFISLLKDKWQKAIAFVYVRNKTLFVVVKHPGFKMELHYNRDLLKSILTHLSSHNSQCRALQADKVIIFHGKHYPVSPEKNRETIPYYEELAYSKFDIQTEDAELHQAFEEIKKNIRCNMP